MTPGQEGWVQLELRDPVVAVRGDRYILRRPSPGETLGGGVLVDHQPKGRHKRFDQQVLRSLESLSQGTPAEILFGAALSLNAAPVKEIVTRSRLDAARAGPALEELVSAGNLVLLEQGKPDIHSDLLAMALPHWNSLCSTTMQMVEAYHADYPLRRGIPREELKSKLKFSGRAFNALVNKLVGDGRLVDRGAFLAKSGHEISFDAAQQEKIDRLRGTFEKNPFNPPGLKDCQALVGVEVMNALIERGEYIAVSGDVLFRKPDYEEAVTRIPKLIKLVRFIGNSILSSPLYKEIYSFLSISRRQI